jgi:hypothetical protein
MCFLDSWLHGASAAYRVDMVYDNISGIKSNNILGGLVDFFVRDTCGAGTGCMFQKKLFLSIVKSILKNNFLNRIPVLRYRGYRYSGTFFSTLYTRQLVL